MALLQRLSTGLFLLLCLGEEALPQDSESVLAEAWGAGIRESSGEVGEEAEWFIQLNPWLKNVITRELSQRSVCLFDDRQVRAILDELEEDLVERIAEDDEEHTDAGLILDHVLLAVQEARLRHELGAARLERSA